MANDMKQTGSPKLPGSPGSNPTFKQSCVASGRKILAQITQARAAIHTEARRTVRAPERWLRLALNEAEALAWETRFPHLVFPTLAWEKVQALTGWAARQQALRQTEFPARRTA